MQLRAHINNLFFKKIKKKNYKIETFFAAPIGDIEEALSEKEHLDPKNLISRVL